MVHWSKAYEWATRFMNEMNPEKWDGTGEQPASFKPSVIWEQPRIYHDEKSIEIVFEHDEGIWKTYIDYTEHGESIDHFVLRSIGDTDKIARSIQRMLGLLKNDCHTAKYGIIDDKTHTYVKTLSREEAVKKYGNTEIVSGYTTGGHYPEFETDVWLDIDKVYWDMYGIDE